MRKITVGILAHVDAGKTTLSESILYLSGKIRVLGRVDNRDSYLDTNELERLRGITIFSKQAIMEFGDTEITLLDTPGHVDFSAEMERSLQVLDYAILVISASDGVQNHTRTLWDLLKLYNIPTFIFVNKMDQNTNNRESIMASIHKELSDRCIEFDTDEDQSEILALCDDDLMETYIENANLSKKEIKNLIRQRKSFPVYFGSALRQIGTEKFIRGLIDYVDENVYPSEFGAKVYKISRDNQNNRLTHMKITAGSIKVKDIITNDQGQEKINQIRLYSGDKFTAINEAFAGSICAVTGLNYTKAGQGLGIEKESSPSQLEPVLSYQILLEEGVSELQMLPMLREIEEEEPELRVLFSEVHKSIHIQVMGLVQLEILKSIIKERFNVDISYGHGEIVYKETISEVAEGVGHFEPLRHYSEVHLLLEPAKRGSGMSFDSKCSEDLLGKNWQNLVLKHLKEKSHIGVLTGSHITDVKVTLVSGRAHNKHTAGGDFREATFRAIRQGLMQARPMLLEPYYKFKLELPESMVGKAMTDIDKMHGTCQIDQTNHKSSIIVGEAPVACMQNYQHEVYAYTKGEGRLSISVKGYDICHNEDEVINRMAYDAHLDSLNPTGSIFCAKGSGFYVAWDEVKDYMHVESFLKEKVKTNEIKDNKSKTSYDDDFISLEEIDSIINSTHFANSGKKNIWKKSKSVKETYYKSLDSSQSYSGGLSNLSYCERYLLVDAYNIIYAWPELELLAKENMENARLKLMNILSNYQSMSKYKIMLVFDAYRVEGRKESLEEYDNIQIVFTGEAQTADHFIEKFARTNKEKYQITVATSDGLEQIIIRGAGARLLSASDLRDLVYGTEDKLRSEHLSVSDASNNKLEDLLSKEIKSDLKKKL